MKLFDQGQEDMSVCTDLSSLQERILNELSDRPFFFFYHYTGVHGVPYHSGPFLGNFLPKEAGLVDLISQKKIYGEVPPNDQYLVEKLHLRYDEAVLYQDQELGLFINELKNAGIYDSAMIIITADHGQTFHPDFTSHCTPLLSYPETHVPLLIMYTEGVYLL